MEGDAFSLTADYDFEEFRQERELPAVHRT